MSVTMSVTMGTDPELFAVKDGQVIPAWFALGEQHEPYKLREGTLVGDGAAVEFTVTPSKSVNTLMDNLAKNIADTRKIVQDTCGADLSVIPQAIIEKKYIDMLDPSYGPNFSLQVFGCNPDRTVYNFSKTPRRPDPKKYPYRTTGGHIHLEIGDLVFDPGFVYYLVAALDQTIGTAMVLQFQSEQAKSRKRLYGQAGTIRTNERLGLVEYRCPPAQIIQDRYSATIIFKSAQEVANHLIDLHDNGASYNTFLELLGGIDTIKDVACAINDHDSVECWDLLQQFAARNRKVRAFSTMFSELSSLKWHRYNHFDLEWGTLDAV